jgi:hypothetical protein
MEFFNPYLSIGGILSNLLRMFSFLELGTGGLADWLGSHTF